MTGSIVSMGRVGGVRGPLHNLPPDPNIRKTLPQLGQACFLTLALQLQQGQINL